jgi:hypothetical protein
MGLRKPGEFPVDVVFHPAPYLFVTLLAVLVILLVSGGLRMAGVFTAILLVILFLLPTLGAVRRHRERRKAGLV